MPQWKYTDSIPLIGGERPDLAEFAPERIPVGWFEHLRNVFYDKDGILRKRKGFGEWETDPSLATIAYGLYTLYKATGVRYRLALDTHLSHLRLHYLEQGGAWANIANFLPTPYLRTRGARLRDSQYITNGIDDLRFFESPTVYGKCGVWPPTSQPSTTFGDDPATDSTNDVDLSIDDSGFLQYCVVFLYEDPKSYDNAALYEDPNRSENFFESPASARTDLINAHWGDIDLSYNENFGYIRQGPSLTIPINTEIDAEIRDRIRHRKIFRRYKKYADQAWGAWAEVQEIYTGTDATWIDVEDTPSGTRDFDADVPPIGKLITSTGDRLFMGNLKDRATRQPSLPATWRGGSGYSPEWPYRVRIDITDTNDRIVTRGMVEMKFTNDSGHSSSKNPDPTGDGAYLSGLAGVTLGSIGTATFVGGGLDDMVLSGVFDGAGTINYKVQIDQAAAAKVVDTIVNDTGVPNNGTHTGVTTTSAGAGAGMIVTVTVVGNVITNVVVTTGGNGYVVDETVTLTGLVAAGGGGNNDGTVDIFGIADTYKWSDDGGSTWDAEKVYMTGSIQTLNNGVTLKWGAITGHTVDHYYTFSCTIAVEQDFCFVADDGITEIGYVVTGRTTANDIFFLVEISQLVGTEAVYLFYGDTAAPGYESDQWESVFHKLYAQTDMHLLADFDQDVTGHFPNQFTSLDSVERVCGRIVDPTGAHGHISTDGGYSDDDSSKIFSSGYCYATTANASYIEIEALSTAAKRDTAYENGTLQFRCWVDYSNLLDGAAEDNAIFGFLDTAGAGALSGTLRKRAGDWYFQIVDGGDLIQDNAAKGIKLPDLIEDMWLFISVAYGTNAVSRVYVDSTLFGSGPVTTTNYDSTSTDNAPYRPFYIGGVVLGAENIIGYHDEVVIWDHEKNTAAELADNFLRRTYWENSLQMEIGTIQEIYDTTESEAIRTARPSRLAWSDSGAPDVFQVDNFRESDTGAELTGLIPFGGNILALYYDEVRILATGAPGTEALFTAIDDITQMWTLSADRTGEVRGLGCIASDSVQATKEFVLFYGLAGLQAYVASGFFHLSKALDKYLDAIPVCYRREIQGQIFPKKDLYLMSVPTGDNTATDQDQTDDDSTVAFGMAAAGANEEKISQSFIPIHRLLHTVTLKKENDTGTFAGDVIVSIQGDDDGEPDGIDIATTTITNSTWGMYASDTFGVVIEASLTPGDTYYIVIDSSTHDNSHHPNLSFQAASNEYADGALFEYKNSAWAEVTDDDLYFVTSYAYHDRIHVLDLRSVGPDPDKVRWSEFRWQDDDFFKARGFALFDDVGDDGELVVLDSGQAKMWEYDNDEYYDDSSSHKILVEAKTGLMNLRNVALRKVMTNYVMPDSAGIYNVDELNLKVYDEIEVLQTLLLIEDGVEELLARGVLAEGVAFEWYEETDNGLTLKDFLFEYRSFRRKRKMLTPPTPEFEMLTTATPFVTAGVSDIDEEMLTTATAEITVA